MHYKVPYHPSLLPIFKQVSVEILLGGIDDELKSLNAMLKHTQEVEELSEYLYISHFLIQKSNCQNLGLHKLHCKICVSLLRYIKDIRPDKAFYEAGLSCKVEKQISMSFVFFNRFLDLADAIDDPNAGMDENNDFVYTDIPSVFDLSLPEKNYVDESKRSEIKDYILSISVQKKTELTLPSRTCERCGTKLYEYALSCKKCQYKWEPCIVTGVPLFANVPSIKCKFCGRNAAKECWNEYVQKTQHCPWCDNVQTIY